MPGGDLEGYVVDDGPRGVRLWAGVGSSGDFRNPLASTRSLALVLLFGSMS